MIQKLVACNGVATVLLCKTGRSEAGRRWGWEGGGGQSGRESISEPLDTGRGQLLLASRATCCLLCGKESGEPPPSLQQMKFDIVEMTGAMTALCQDGGGKGAGGEGGGGAQPLTC